MANVQEYAVSTGFSHLRHDGPGDNIPWSKVTKVRILRHEGLAVLAAKNAALPSHGLGDQEHWGARKA